MDKETRLLEIIKIAHRLQWILPPNKTSYPLMQMSEVEKCMIAMVDDVELERMRTWERERVGDKAPYLDTKEIKCPKCGGYMLQELITGIPFCPRCLYCPHPNAKLERLPEAASVSGMMKDGVMWRGEKDFSSCSRPLCEHEYWENGMWRCKLKQGQEDDYCTFTSPDKPKCKNYLEG